MLRAVSSVTMLLSFKHLIIPDNFIFSRLVPFGSIRECPFATLATIYVLSVSSNVLLSKYNPISTLSSFKNGNALATQGL